MSNSKKKLFISHASEDKDDFVRPLAETLSKDYDVWYDEYKLKVGMSLLREINRGLVECDYGIVVLSPSFFAKKWPQDELDGLYALEDKDRKVILPVWKDIDSNRLKKYSPILAGRKAAQAADGVIKVTEDIKRAIEFFNIGNKPKEGLNKFSNALRKQQERIKSEEIVRSSAGVHIAYKAARETIDLIVSHANAQDSQIGSGLLSVRDNKDNGRDCSVNLLCWIRKLLYMFYHNGILTIVHYDSAV